MLRTVVAALLASTMILLLAGPCAAQQQTPEWDKYWNSLNASQREKAEQIIETYVSEIVPLREKISAKFIELDILAKNRDIDQVGIEALSNEIAKLKTKLYKSRQKLRSNLEKATGAKPPYGSLPPEATLDWDMNFGYQQDCGRCRRY